MINRYCQQVKLMHAEVYMWCIKVCSLLVCMHGNLRRYTHCSASNICIEQNQNQVIATANLLMYQHISTSMQWYCVSQLLAYGCIK